MKVHVQSKDVEKAQNFLKGFGKKAEKAVDHSLKRVRKGIMTDATKNIPKHYGLGPKKIRENTKSSFSILAEQGSHTLTAMVRGNRISLTKYGAKPNTPTAKRPPEGVSVLVGRSKKAITHSFIAKLRSGHTGVFQRKSLVRGKVGGSVYGRRGNPNLERIHKLRGPATPQLMKHEQVSRAITEGAADRFEKNFNHEIDRFLEKVGARSRRSK